MPIKYISVALIAFFSESIDSSLGMGYGTILTPILIFIGFEPLEIIPLILLSEFITGLLSALMHHQKGNVNLSIKSREFKVAIILASCSIVGTVFAAFIAISVSKTFITGYISFLLMIIGVSTFTSIKKEYKFSWLKIFFLGITASFNKGMSGGGYGPLVTGGQLLSGLKSKNAVGITSLAEGLTSLVGTITYFMINQGKSDYFLGLSLIAGAILSIPISVNIVKIINEKLFKKMLSLSILSLGIFTFFKTYSYLFNYTNLPLIFATILVTIPFTFHWGRTKSINID